MSTLRVPKTSGTYADALLAFGLARLVHRWLRDTHGWRDIVLQDSGPYYEIRVIDRRGRSFPLPDPDQARYFESIAYYITNRRFAEPPEEGFPSYDVDKIWDQVRTYAEMRSQLSKGGIRGTDAEQRLRELEPPPWWQVVNFLGTRQMQAHQTYNRIVAAWMRLRDRFGEHLRIFIPLATQAEGYDEVFKVWRRIAKDDGVSDVVTASQLLNPHQGKGQNQSKIASIQPGNIKSPWPLEYLKAAGLWEAAFPRLTSDTRDWKVYILAPRRIRLRDVRRVYERFARVLWQEGRQDTTTLKTDITSVLLFYKTWLDYALEHRDDPDMPTNPSTVVHGFYVVQFKLMSAQAYTMLNQSFLRLPGWGRVVKTPQEVQAWKDLLDEHLSVVHSIDEAHSDGYDLLKHYRDFVAGEKWESFFTFTLGYAHYIMQRLAQNKYVALFTISNLRRLLMAGPKQFSRIVENTGFQNVAYAIRHSTVVPQFWKAQYKQGKVKQPPLYDIRYGLGAELKRKAVVKEEFLTALADFLHNYSQENVQILERTGQQMRKDVRTSDLEEITRLVDEFGSEVVAHLLVAYGYAREPREAVTSDEAIITEEATETQPE